MDKMMNDNGGKQTVAVVGAFKENWDVFRDYRIVQIRLNCGLSYSDLYLRLIEISKDSRVIFFPYIHCFQNDCYCELFLKNDDIDTIGRSIHDVMSQAAFSARTAVEYSSVMGKPPIYAFNRLVRYAIGYSYTLNCKVGEFPSNGILIVVNDKNTKKGVTCLKLSTEIETGEQEELVYPSITVEGGAYRFAEDGFSGDETSTRILTDGVVGRGGNGKVLQRMPKGATRYPQKRATVNAEEFSLSGYRKTRSWALRDMIQHLRLAGFESLMPTDDLFQTYGSYKKTDQERVDYEVGRIAAILKTEKVRVYTNEPIVGTQIETAQDTLKRALMTEYRYVLNDKKSVELFGQNLASMCGTKLPVSVASDTAVMRAFRTGRKHDEDERVVVDSEHPNTATIYLDEDDLHDGKMPQIVLSIYDSKERGKLQIRFRRNFRTIVDIVKPRDLLIAYHSDPAAIMSDDGKLGLSVVLPEERDQDNVYQKDLCLPVQHITTDNIANVDAMKTCLTELAIRSDLVLERISLVPPEALILGKYYEAFSLEQIFRLTINADGRLEIKIFSLDELYHDNRIIGRNVYDRWNITQKKRSKQSDQNQIPSKPFWKGMCINGRPYEWVCTRRQMIPSADRSEASYYRRSKDTLDDRAAEYGLCWREVSNGLEYSSGYLTDRNDPAMSGYPNTYRISTLDQEKSDITPEGLHSWLFTTLVRRSQASAATPYPFKYLHIWEEPILKQYEMDDAEE